MDENYQKTLTQYLEVADHSLDPEADHGRGDGRDTSRKTIGTDKIIGLLDPGTVGTVQLASLAVTQPKMAATSVGQGQMKTEIAILAFGSGDTVKSTTVTAGNIVIGFYVSAVVGAPAFADLQLSISSTTLIGTRIAAPGGVTSITYTVVMLKT